MRNTKIFSHQILSLRLYKLSRNFWFHFFRHLGQVKKSAWAGCLHSNTKWYGRSLILLGISMSYLMIKRMFLIIFVTSDKDEIEISPEVGRKDRSQLRPISRIRSWDSMGWCTSIFAKFEQIQLSWYLFSGSVRAPTSLENPRNERIGIRAFQKIKNYRKRFTELGERASQRPSVGQPELEFFGTLISMALVRCLLCSSQSKPKKKC